ncbi:MAG: methyltransferase domain-containing protein [Pseudonocardiaceae bacterium]|nr:methyltransferase domain-containing protein [Pseudonocardiaceae bacterium]
MSETSLTGHRHFVPAMGRTWLLRLYDPFTRLLGVPAAHRYLAGEAGMEPGHDVLEIGCGTANLALLVKAEQPATRVVGLDPDGKALNLARRKAARKGLPLQLDRGFGDALPYPDESFDRVLSALMLHHLEPAAKLGTLREVRRVLRPGGRFHLLDFDGSHHHAGFFSRRRMSSRLIHENRADHLLALTREAGLTDPVQTGQYSFRAGRCAVIRADR